MTKQSREAAIETIRQAREAAIEDVAGMADALDGTEWHRARVELIRQCNRQMDTLSRRAG